MKKLCIILIAALMLLAVGAALAHVRPALAQDQQPISVMISGLQYDEANGVYRVSFNISNPDVVWKLIVTLEEENGPLVDGAGGELETHGKASLRTEFSTSNLKSGRKYILRVQAVDLVGTYLQKPSDSGGVQDPSEATILATKQFTYEKVEATPVPFTVESVNPRYDISKLVIDLDVPDPGQILKYEGFVVNKGGQKVLTFGPDLFKGAELAVDLPALMKQQSGDEPQEYKLTAFLTTKDDKRLQATFDFEVKPPAPDPWTTVAMNALRDNPVVQGGIVMIVVIVACWYIFSSRRKRPEGPLARPPIDSTQRVRISVTPPRLRLRVVQSPGAARGTEKTVTRFPCVVGRKDCDIVIPGDPEISRQHMEIRVKDGEYYLMDLGSKNGTFIEDVGLRPRSPVRVDHATSVRLGSKTCIELEPEI